MYLDVSLSQRVIERKENRVHGVKLGAEIEMEQCVCLYRLLRVYNYSVRMSVA